MCMRGFVPVDYQTLQQVRYAYIYIYIYICTHRDHEERQAAVKAAVDECEQEIEKLKRALEASAQVCGGLCLCKNVSRFSPICMLAYVCICITLQRAPGIRAQE
jgi:hypothetical protein